ncbi:MAG: hypothetical protein HY782_19595 [Chloroflexi bacterium]|nr:hypothetical protein [Chloroflexota bacterium]
MTTMAEQAEARVERATPAEWSERLEIFRERFRLQLIDESKFDEVMRAFQFTDDLGHTWMPGATTKRWYRWDRKRWTAAPPPQQLTSANMPTALALAWDRQIAAPIAIDTKPDQAAAAPVRPEPPRVEGIPPPAYSAPEPPPPPALTRATCPHCGESYIPPARFCPNCAEPLTGERKAKPGRPTDLPERGTTRSRPKPTDLPK